MADGQLTTHVLDTAAGRPAAGLTLALWGLGEARRLLAEAETNADGRTDAPLLAGAAMAPGRYEIVFAAGAYLRAAGHPVGDPAFLEDVPVRFAIASAGARLHVPLLLAPHGYTTYRGS